MVSRRKADAVRPLLFALILGAVSATSGQSPPNPITLLGIETNAATRHNLEAMQSLLVNAPGR